MTKTMFYWAGCINSSLGFIAFILDKDGYEAGFLMGITCFLLAVIEEIKEQRKE